MDLDLILASAHHLAVFALVVLLAVEFAILRPGLSPAVLKRLGGIDGAYGMCALLVLIIGFARVFSGSAGSGYYLTNWVFWTKIGLFVIVGLLSIVPTIRILAWRKALAADPGFVPADAEVRGLRRYLHAELGVLFLIPLFAAAMARGYGA